jgi:sec-independent protein translocase protein TatB
MFDIGFLELLLILVIALVVIGPQRLPNLVRGFLLWRNRCKQGIKAVQTELGQELDIDEIKRRVHNQQVLDQLNNQQPDKPTTHS